MKPKMAPRGKDAAPSTPREPGDETWRYFFVCVITAAGFIRIWLAPIFLSLLGE